MSCLEYFPEEYHKLPFHEYCAKNILIAALKKEAEVMLWHLCLIHCGSHSLKSASLYVDGVPNLLAFNFDDVVKCLTCLKTNLIKSFGKHFYPGTTKKIKSKHLKESSKDILAINDGFTRYHVCTIVFKVFEKVEHQGTVSGYDPLNKLYQIIYDDNDTKIYYHNEVQDQQKRSLSKKKQ